MLTIGVDAHKTQHAAVALDALGREVARTTIPNSPDGWARLAAWAAAAAPLRWGIEGAGHYGRGLADLLVADGQVVYDINARWTAQERKGARTPGKSDRLDAQAVARVVLREAETLAPLRHDEDAAVLALLSGERDAAVAEATRLRNQLHALLLHLDPQYYKERLPPLTTPKGVDALRAYVAPRPGVLAEQQAAGVRRLAERLALAVAQAADLKQQIEARATAGFSPLIDLKGVAPLTAGALAGVLGTGDAFTSEDQFAAYAGVAPLEASSAGRVRHRLNRGGNRQLNAILYRIAVTQGRCYPPAQAYLARRQQGGKTLKEARRCLKRYIARAIWRLWQRCLALRQPTPQPVGAFAEASYFSP